MITVYLRERTGSWHPCAKGDPGAVPFFGFPDIMISKSSPEPTEPLKAIVTPREGNKFMVTLPKADRRTISLIEAVTGIEVISND